jgi:cytochrome b pre-mRNA-processing protein 3
MKLLRFLGVKKYDKQVLSLYASIILQARTESFYSLYGVPDTLNGRFDLITLHMFIVLRRLKDLGDEGVKVSQDLFDIMFADMDKNMREMGVGDLSVGKKVKILATAFYGRIKSYDNGIADLNDETLLGCLRRNLFLDTVPNEEHVLIVMNYLAREVKASKEWTIADIKTNNFSFGNIVENRFLSD